MTNFTTAVNKNKLYKLINVKQYDKAKNYLYSEHENVYKMALTKLKPYLDAELIYKEELDTFIQIIEKNIIYDMLKDESNIQMSILTLNEIIQKKEKLENMRKVKRH